MIKYIEFYNILNFEIYRKVQNPTLTTNVLLTNMFNPDE